MQCSGIPNESQQPIVRFFRNAPRHRVRYIPNVADWYLKEWLATLRKTQAFLVRETDYPKAKVSDLVTGKQRYNRDILNDVAKALNLQPFELLMHPADANSLKRLRVVAKEMVDVPFLGEAGDDLADTAERKHSA